MLSLVKIYFSLYNIHDMMWISCQHSSSHSPAYCPSFMFEFSIFLLPDWRISLISSILGRTFTSADWWEWCPEFRICSRACAKWRVWITMYSSRDWRRASSGMPRSNKSAHHTPCKSTQSGSNAPWESIWVLFIFSFLFPENRACCLHSLSDEKRLTYYDTDDTTVQLLPLSFINQVTKQKQKQVHGRSIGRA